MKRVLLLTDRQRDLQTQQCIEQISTGLAADYEFSEQHIDGDGVVGVINQFARLRKAAATADLIHAWGHRALRMATLASSSPILFTPLPDDPASSVRWLRAAMERRTIHVMPLSSGEDRLLISRGVPAEACSLTRPGIRVPRQIGRDDDLRSKLGFTPDNKVILLAGESRRHADHEMALLALAVLWQMDNSYRALILGDGDRAQAVEDLHSDWNARFLVNARRALGPATRYEDVLLAADAAVVCAPDRLAVVPVLACMAAGLPLVAPATLPASEILEDRHTALLYSPRRARNLAHRILTLFESPDLRRTIIDQARAEAYELFSVSRFLDNMRRIYG